MPSPPTTIAWRRPVAWPDPRRMGSSTRNVLTVATAIDRATSATVVAGARSPPRAMAGNTSRGQCQRYNA